jgi:hypothetical protein
MGMTCQEIFEEVVEGVPFCEFELSSQFQVFDFDLGFKKMTLPKINRISLFWLISGQKSNKILHFWPISHLGIENLSCPSSPISHQSHQKFRG